MKALPPHRSPLMLAAAAAVLAGGLAFGAMKAANADDPTTWVVDDDHAVVMTTSLLNGCPAHTWRDAVFMRPRWQFLGSHEPSTEAMMRDNYCVRSGRTFESMTGVRGTGRFGDVRYFSVAVRAGACPAQTILRTKDFCLLPPSVPTAVK